MWYIAMQIRRIGGIFSDVNKKNDLKAELAKLAKEPTSAQAWIEHLLPEIEEALKAGRTRVEVHAVVSKTVEMPLDTFYSALKRARAKAKKRQNDSKLIAEKDQSGGEPMEVEQIDDKPKELKPESKQSEQDLSAEEKKVARRKRMEEAQASLEQERIFDKRTDE